MYVCVYMVWSAVCRIFLLTKLSNRCYSPFFLISKCMSLCVCYVCVRVCVSIYLYMYIYMHICMYIYIYVYVSVCVHIKCWENIAQTNHRSTSFLAYIFFVPFLCT